MYCTQKNNPNTVHNSSISVTENKLQYSKYSLFIIMFSLFVTSPQQVFAVEPLSAQELAIHCKDYPAKPKSSDAQFCLRYIQGFIDGAIATDPQVLINVEAELKRKETFTERAIRTRKTSRMDTDEQATRYAEFCLGKSVPLREVVTKVAQHTQTRGKIKKGIQARAIVYGALRHHYPCKQAPVKPD